MKLIEHGKNPQTPVAVIQWGATSSQTTVTGDLKTIEEIVRQNNIKHLAIILIGQVVRMREKIKWFENVLEVVVSE